ncbi:MAG TPA: prolyl oligopeptidase family serine peptidase [Gemmatimonadaceae bacterium]|nr:prolyl oligopeptidase family serine peptidase [Gemmatimonadaceae bacterium]
MERSAVLLVDSRTIDNGKTHPMRSLLTASLLPLALAAAVGAQTPANPAYPVTAKGTQVDVYHGTSIADPYRWLENTDSPETKAWVEAQNRVTFSYLAAIPERAAIRDRLTKLWDYPKYYAPEKVGDRLFYFENSGLQNQNILFVRDGNGPPRVLIDPNTLSSDGTVALSGTEPSIDGKMLAYSVSTSGSDWREIRVRNIETGRDTKDTLKWVKFSGMAWTKDNKGFFYSAYDAQTSGNTLTNVNRGQRLYYHRLNAPQSSDIVVFEDKAHPDWLYNAQLTNNGTFLIITIHQGTDRRTRIYFVYLEHPKKPRIDNPLVRLIDRFDAENEFVFDVGDNFLVRTDLGAPKGRLVSIDINNEQPGRWLTVIPENRDALQSVLVAGNKLVASYLQDAYSTIRIYGMPNPNDMLRGRGQIGGGPAGSGRQTGNARNPRGDQADPVSAPGYPFLGEVPLPAIGTVNAINGKPNDDHLYYSFASYLYPRTVFHYDLKRRVNELFKAPKLAFDATQYETHQVFYNSKDGTRIPMFVTMKRGTVLDGHNPTILYGYGGFNIAETPSFSPANLVWLEMGGLYAVANIRGGGEYGKEWHEAGMLDRKQNVFDDFIAAAQYLIAQKYTSTPKLAISGGSNGGLLVGAVMNQRPDLFGAALPAVGVMDMLRFQKFTIGWAWASDYGSSDDAKQFEYLRKYSPLHNIKSGTKYPATLITTADHDDRVVPGHSFKYAAALQAAQSGPAPILIRIETKAGHGAGKPTSKQIEEAADKFAFLVKNLGMKLSLPQ